MELFCFSAYSIPERDSSCDVDDAVGLKESEGW